MVDFQKKKLSDYTQAELDELSENGTSEQKFALLKEQLLEIADRDELNEFLIASNSALRSAFRSARIPRPNLSLMNNMIVFDLYLCFKKPCPNELFGSVRNLFISPF